MNTQQAKIAIQNFINNPKERNTQQQYTQMIEIITKLCDVNEKVNFYLVGSVTCNYCQEIVGKEELTLFPCGHSCHNLCFKALYFKLVGEKEFDQFDPLILRRMQCDRTQTCKGIQLSESIFYQLFDRKVVEKKREILFQNLTMIIQKESIIMKKEILQNKGFLCAKCQQEKLGDDTFILEQCSHKYCFDCLREEILVQLGQDDNVIKSFTCPNCQAPITYRDVELLLPEFSYRFWDKKNILKQTLGTGTIYITRCPTIQNGLIVNPPNQTINTQLTSVIQPQQQILQSVPNFMQISSIPEQNRLIQSNAFMPLRKIGIQSNTNTINVGYQKDNFIYNQTNRQTCNSVMIVYENSGDPQCLTCNTSFAKTPELLVQIQNITYCNQCSQWLLKKTGDNQIQCSSILV